MLFNFINFMPDAVLYPTVFSNLFDTRNMERTLSVITKKSFRLALYIEENQKVFYTKSSFPIYSRLEGLIAKHNMAPEALRFGASQKSKELTLGPADSENDAMSLSRC